MVVVSNARLRCDDPSIDLDIVDAMRVGYSRGHMRNTVNGVHWVNGRNGRNGRDGRNGMNGRSASSDLGQAPATRKLMVSTSKSV